MLREHLLYQGPQQTLHTLSDLSLSGTPIGSIAVRQSRRAGRFSVLPFPPEPPATTTATPMSRA